MDTAQADLFVNPTAGRGRAGKRLPRILELLRSDGLAPIVHESVVTRGECDEHYEPWILKTDFEVASWPKR